MAQMSIVKKASVIAVVAMAISAVNTKFLNTLPLEWSKFVTDVKLVRNLHTTNVDQLHAYLGQHEYHANEVRPYTSGSSGTSGKQRAIVCYNCKGEGHMSKQCTKPKRKRDEQWFKDKVLLSQEKDTVIMNLKERLKSLSGNEKEEKIKRELEEILINLELNHRVTKLVTKNEHLKQTYKQLYDSIKSSRVRSKEQCDDLIKQVNIKSTENFDLNASLQEKVLVITALKETVSKLKGKAVVDEAVTLHPIDPELLKIDVALLAPKLRNNRTTHTEYLRHTQEETATLREIVKSERLLNPLNNSLDYTCKYTKRIQELLIIFCWDFTLRDDIDGITISYHSLIHKG
nr:hypothetical protein [Tanacetum cinerariifolium]